MEMTNKEKDRLAILNYLEGKELVNVEELIKQSGAEKLRVYPILFEESQKGTIKIVERDALGAPVSVKAI